MYSRVFKLRNQIIKRVFESKACHYLVRGFDLQRALIQLVAARAADLRGELYGF